jgi:DNA adenine methylase
MSLNHKQRPFLKWAGNKYRCLDEILPRLHQGKRLIEPFAGSGAIFLNTTYDAHLLNDQNPELINLFHFLKHEGEDFIQDCRQWFQPQYNLKSRYNELRQYFNQSTNRRERAILFLYLNRHAFNGLCRFNLQGKFNVPFGAYVKPYFPLNEMRYFHQKSQNCSFTNHDFIDTFQIIEAGDIIYCDPPYHPLTQTASFTSYTKQQFLQEAQLKLLEESLKAREKGADIFISNHDTPFTRALYREACQIFSFNVTRTISSKGDKRKPVPELLAYFKGV